MFAELNSHQVHPSIEATMGSQLMRITAGIVAVANEYLQLKRENRLPIVHVADCYPISPEAVLEIWDTALFELRRRGNTKEFELAYVTVFKQGGFAAEYVPINASEDQPSLFD